LIVWVDAQLSPALAAWLTSTFKIEAYSVRYLGLRDAKDQEIYLAAREAGAVLFTKDRDFVSLVERLGAPPQVVWITCGNTSNEHLRGLFKSHFSRLLLVLARGEPIVEVGGP
jgi:predicted nuclease of predicted toxin-antitoxin system